MARKPSESHPNDGPRDQRSWHAEPDPWEKADREWNRPWPPVEPDAATGSESADYQPTTASPENVSPKNVSRAYGDGMREAGPYLGLGAQIGGAMILFVGLGVFVDRWLDSSPWGVLAGASLGMAGIVALVVRLAREGQGK